MLEFDPKIFFFTAVHALANVDNALAKQDKNLLLPLLKSQSLGLRNVKDENIDFYVVHLQEARDNKRVI